MDILVMTTDVPTGMMILRLPGKIGPTIKTH